MGQILYIPAGAFTLTMSFNQPVSSLMVDFAVINPGVLRLMDGAETLNVPSSMVGGTFEGGTLTYNNPLGFTSVTLASFSNLNVQQPFAIDNLRLTAVPEPGSLVLAMFGVAVGWRRRQQNRCRQQATSARSLCLSR